MAEIRVVNWAGGTETALEDLQTEQALIGAILSDSGLVRYVPPSFSPDHYADPWHAEVHRAVVEIAQPGVPVRLPVLQQLGLDDPEKREYIAKLYTAVLSMVPATISLYADTVTDMYRRRGLCQAAAEMRNAALTGREAGIPAIAAVARAMNRLDELASVADARQHVTLDDAMDEALRRADQVGAGCAAGISTGFPSIDEVLGGLEPGTMTVIAGRPGMGKSSLGFQIAVNVARAAKERAETEGEIVGGVLAISLEMSAAELGRRALSTVARVPLSHLKRGCHRVDVPYLIEARKELAGLPLSIEDGAALTAGMIALKARAAKRRHGLGLILVDHLHIVRPDESDVRQGATWAVGRVSGAMKRLAKDMECPVLVLAQLSRGVEGRDDKRPTLADLRHSGDIEQDADAVGFVYRPEYYLGAEPQQNSAETAEKFHDRLAKWNADRLRLHGKAELIFAKVRDGEARTVPLHFRGDTTSFSETSA